MSLIIIVISWIRFIQRTLIKANVINEQWRCCTQTRSERHHNHHFNHWLSCQLCSELIDESFTRMLSNQSPSHVFQNLRSRLDLLLYSNQQLKTVSVSQCAKKTEGFSSFGLSITVLYVRFFSWYLTGHSAEMKNCHLTHLGHILDYTITFWTLIARKIHFYIQIKYCFLPSSKTMTHQEPMVTNGNQ